MPPGLSAASLPCPVALCCSFLQACSGVHLLSPQRRTVLRRLSTPESASFLNLPKASASSRWKLNTCSKDQAWALTVTETRAHTGASFSSCSWPALRSGRSLGWITLSDLQKAQARPGQADGTTSGLSGRQTQLLRWQGGMPGGSGPEQANRLMPIGGEGAAIPSLADKILSAYSLPPVAR